jgi:hypothetical protein
MARDMNISSHGIKSSILEKPEISTTNWYDKTGDQQPDAKPLYIRSIRRLRFFRSIGNEVLEAFEKAGYDIMAMSSILEKPEISTTNWYDKTGDQQPDAKPTIHPHHIASKNQYDYLYK